MKETIPAYPDERCQVCDHFCLDASTPPPFEDCMGKQSADNIALYLSFVGLMPRPLWQVEGE